MREDRLGEGERTEHFIVPDGMSSLVKHFFKQSGAELNFGRRVAEVNRRDSLWQARRIRRRGKPFLALICKFSCCTKPVFSYVPILYRQIQLSQAILL